MRRVVQRVVACAVVAAAAATATALPTASRVTPPPPLDNARRACATWRPTSEQATTTTTTETHEHEQEQQEPREHAQDGHGTRDGEHAPPSLPSCLGVVHVTAQNITSVLATRVPVLLYFMLTTHDDVNAYTLLLCRHVDQLNRRLQAAGMAEVYDEHGSDAGLAVKLGVVDCVVAPALVQAFAVHPNAFPVVYCVYKSQTIDRLVGVVAEAQVTELLDAFVAHAKAQTREEREHESKKRTGDGSADSHARATSAGAAAPLPQRHDRDDENALTLLTAAHEKLKNKQLAKAKQLFGKALDYATREMDTVKARYGVAYKKPTRELWAKLRSESCYHTAPSALCGLAMTALAGKQHDEARALIDRVRRDFPYAVHELRDVATAVARVEIVCVAQYDPEADNYATLMRVAPPDEDAVAFYRKHLKLAAAFFFEGTKRNALEECLRLIRAEPKLLRELKDGGVIARDCVLGARAQTPARVLLQHMLDALGPIDADAVLARRLLQQYT